MASVAAWGIDELHMLLAGKVKTTGMAGAGCRWARLRQGHHLGLSTLLSSVFGRTSAELQKVCCEPAALRAECNFSEQLLVLLTSTGHMFVSGHL